MFWFIFSISILNSGTSRDFYEALGLKHDCTDREIEKSYMRLSRKYHPDKNKGDSKAINKYNDINDAYSTLRDANKRRIYDLWGEQGVLVYETQGKDSLEKNNEDELTSQVTRKGKTIRVIYYADLLDFHEGKTHEISITRSTMCRCPESGYFCEKCRGKPTTQENVTLVLTIEKGTEEGTVVTFSNSGDTSESNAPGDIEVALFSRKHPVFRRDGSNLHMNINITLKEMLIGFKRKVTGIDGDEIEIKSEMMNGDEIVIKEKGMSKYMFPGERGDLIVHVVVMWPKNLADEDRKKLADAFKN
ncbi:DnaJ domain containing protein [Histomonas meleagridis]|uniref:DnaJ domain containing protein n=1 Tax=Histomonas meleagridis TaxID=135588 RepID=UPI00355AA244|nr:DnaJ domain containing protein [Histomonas meleagridis]KAH0803737.1 DnaJ domain containing protein [Histomonas meleagridis]